MEGPLSSHADPPVEDRDLRALFKINIFQQRAVSVSLQFLSQLLLLNVSGCA